MDAFNIKDLAGVSEPASKLIDRCGDALVAIGHPFQIVRVAKAEAKAHIIRAQGELQVGKIRAEGAIELSAIQERAFARLALEEGKKQHNIEGIVAKALPGLKDDARPQDIDEDWLANFFDKGRLISTEDMHLLWGRILAGEANEPGTHSKRLINVLQEISLKEAEHFRVLCQFCLDDNLAYPLVYEPSDNVYVSRGIDFPVIQNLVSLNLVTYLSTGLKIPDPPKTIKCTYGGRTFEIAVHSGKTKVPFAVGRVMFTELGRELQNLCSDSSPVEGFAEYLLMKWKEFKYEVTEIS